MTYTPFPDAQGHQALCRAAEAPNPSPLGEEGTKPSLYELKKGTEEMTCLSGP
jgi:hypothetical protein